MTSRYLPESAVEGLKESASELEVEDILDLCFAFAKEPARLTVYLDVLRRKGGQKSQAGACLICFDLAHRGDARFEREFLALVPVMQEFLEGEPGTRPLDDLISDNPYLAGLVAELERRLTDLDPRSDEAPPVAPELDDSDRVLNLLSDDDFEIDLDDFDIFAADDLHQRAEWNRALDTFLAGDARHPAPTRSGFFASEADNLRALERLRDSATSLSASVTPARHLLPLVDLFLASHLRAKNLFGRRNKTRDRFLHAGLANFAGLECPPEDSAPWLLPPTAGDHAWEKVAEHLLDFVSFLGSLPEGSAPDAETEDLARAYIDAHRPQPAPPRLLPEGKNRRRRD